MGLLSGGRPLTRRRGERAGRKRTHGAPRSRSERVAQPKVFGAASCAGHAIHRTRGSTPLGGGGGGGTSDLDTNRGPPIQTPNAKNSCNAGTFTLSNLFFLAIFPDGILSPCRQFHITDSDQPLRSFLSFSRENPRKRSPA